MSRVGNTRTQVQLPSGITCIMLCWRRLGYRQNICDSSCTAYFQSEWGKIWALCNLQPDDLSFHQRLTLSAWQLQTSLNLSPLVTNTAPFKDLCCHSRSRQGWNWIQRVWDCAVCVAIHAWWWCWESAELSTAVCLFNSSNREKDL